MAHIRKDSSRPSTTISFDPEILAALDDYRFENRKENRSQAVEELLIFGLKYKQLVDRKRKKERMLV